MAAGSRSEERVTLSLGSCPVPGLGVQCFDTYAKVSHELAKPLVACGPWVLPVSSNEGALTLRVASSPGAAVSLQVSRDTSVI